MQVQNSEALCVLWMRVILMDGISSEVHTDTATIFRAATRRVYLRSLHRFFILSIISDVEYDTFDFGLCTR